MTFFFLYFSFLLSSGIDAFRFLPIFICLHMRIGSCITLLCFLRDVKPLMCMRERSTRLLVDSAAVVTAFFQACMTEDAFRCPQPGCVIPKISYYHQM